jgi:hypothetical protein
MRLMNTVKDAVCADAITSRDDRFHCSPYHVTMRADACVRRQAMVRAGLHRVDMQRCIDCALGQIVERQSGGPVAVSDVARDASTNGWKAAGATAFDDSPKASRGNRERKRLHLIEGSRPHDDKATLPALGSGLATVSPLAHQLPKAPPGRPALAPPADTTNDAPPASAPTVARKERRMPFCTRSGCKKILRLGKFKTPPPPGTETFCKRHRKEFLAQGSVKSEPQASLRQKPGPTPRRIGETKVEKQERLRQYNRDYRKRLRDGKASSTAGPRRPTASRSAVLPDVSLTQALEAHELVARIGWEQARALATMFEHARTTGGEKRRS